MNMTASSFLIFLMLSSPSSPIQFYTTLEKNCQIALEEAQTIPADRKKGLDQIVACVTTALQNGQEAQLNFICTHNSRRSQLCQAWAFAAAQKYGLSQVRVFSGGTEATACDARTVEALRRAGFQISIESDADNPRYTLLCADGGAALSLYSKTCDSPDNPTNNFCAILVCAQADEACPLVTGADLRIYHGYEDPKRADGQENESEVYDAASRQIAAEMFYIFAMLTQG